MRSVFHWNPLRTFAFARHCYFDERKDDPMVTTTTLLPATDRARRASSSYAANAVRPSTYAWRFGSVASDSLGCGTTGFGTHTTTGFVMAANHPAWAPKQTIKRPARHLELRST